MKLFIPPSICQTLSRELKAAGRREIGGVMVAEYLGAGAFTLLDVSVQRQGGTQITFDRDPVQHQQFLDEFRQKTGHDHGRFNYLGEWHSHPTMAALPSLQDAASMREIVADPAVNTPFAVLMIVRHRLWRGLELSATLFHPSEPPSPVEVLPVPAKPSGSRFRVVERFAGRRSLKLR